MKLAPFALAAATLALVPPAHADPDPAVGAFGIGFISVLIRATRVQITSRRRPDGQGKNDQARRVTLAASARDAYVERVEEADFGTVVEVTLREPYSAREIREWVQDLFHFPSVSVSFVDLDRIFDLADAAQTLSVQVPDWARGLVAADASKPESVGLVTQFRSLIEKRLSELPAADRAADDVQSLSRSVAFFVDRAGLPQLPRETVSASLGARIELPPLGTWPRHPGFDAWVFWVPVALDDFALGVEWRSMHGFVVVRGRVRRSAMVPPMKIMKVRSHDSDYDDGPGAVEGEETDTVDFLGRRKRDRALDALGGMDRVVATDDSLMIGATDVAFSLVEYLESRFVDASDEVTTDKRGEPSLEAIHQAVNKGLMKFGDPETFDGFGVAEGLGNDLFQDGIRLPIRAWWIAPLGACRATANLTAAARLRLNVTRHAIDEDPTFVGEWCRAVAARVQEAAVAKVVSALDSAHLEWNVGVLCAADKGRVPRLLLHSEMELRRLVGEAYAKRGGTK
jgi:hypothetical protein